jgi:hypothetical protein
MGDLREKINSNPKNPLKGFFHKFKQKILSAEIFNAGFKSFTVFSLFD